MLGKAELDALLAERERLNLELQQIIDEQTEPWGVKVSTVEVKDVELPADMQRAISRQAEAERERRAKIIAADGEFQAAEKLSQAANIISQNPATLQLRYLQTLVEIGVNNSIDDRLPAADRPDQAAWSSHMRASSVPPPAHPSSPPPERSGAAAILSAPEVRIDQLTGLRAILAPGRAERPDAFDAAPAGAAARRRRELPVLRGARGPHPARGLGRTARAAASPTRPGWTAALGPEPLPGARRRAEPSAEPASDRRAESGLASSIDPLGASTRGPRPSSSAPQPADGRARGDRQRARARDLARPALRASGSRARSPPGASGCAPTPTPPTCT